MARRSGSDLPADLQRYFPSPIVSAVCMPRAGNSILYRVTLRDHSCIVKRYAPAPEDHYDRGLTECCALSFLRDRGFTNVPRLLRFYPEDHVAVLSLEKGRTPRIEDVGRQDVVSLAEFVGAVYSLGDTEKAKFPAERTACLSPRAFVRVIEQRLERIRRARVTQSRGAQVRRFLENEFLPALETLLGGFPARVREAGLSMDAELPMSDQVLAPGDFGFHNALVNGARRVFLDFEYFGRDDPARQVLHFLHHDRHIGLSRRLKQLFLVHLSHRAGLTRAYDTRLRLLDPLVGMEWVLLYLNVFSDGHHQWVGDSAATTTGLLDERLARARRKLGDASYFR